MTYHEAGMAIASLTQRITTFRHGDLRFEVSDLGPLDGDVVILLHGYPQTRSCWNAVLPLLAAKGYRTLAFDQRGYAAGARPRGRRSYLVDLLRSDVLALADAVGAKRFHLIGHDWGSIVGWTVAAHHPDRVRTWTSVSLPHPYAYLRSLISSPQLLRSWYVLFFQLPWLPEWFMTRGGGARDRSLQQNGMDSEMLERFRTEMVAGGAVQGGINWYRAIPWFSATPKVTVPTTHIWGARDRSLERRGAALCADYAIGPYRFIELDADHWIPDSHPQEIANAFLQQAAHGSDANEQHVASGEASA